MNLPRENHCLLTFDRKGIAFGGTYNQKSSFEYLNENDYGWTLGGQMCEFRFCLQLTPNFIVYLHLDLYYSWYFI